MIGFLLLTHEDPSQIQHLVAAIGSLFGDPPIVVHHDFSKCPLETARFPPNVTFVQPSLTTGWGRFSLVEATLRGLELLFSRNRDLTWAVFLSGSDYPIKPADAIEGELINSGADCFLSHRRVHCNATKDDWQREFAGRYLRVAIPGTRRQVPFSKIPVPNHLVEAFSVFGKDRQCYAGSQWFSINRRATEHLLRIDRTDHPFRRHYSGVPVADESYVHTILCNNRDLNIINDHKRFFHWGEGGHNTILTNSDLPALRASGAHFARKVSFAKEPELKSLLDAMAFGS